jgi:flavin reductase (DIM6/NTAB) family NADH-FMN oxidoreductase RutF
MDCEKGRSLLRSHACLLGLGDDCPGSLGYSIAGATARARPRQKQVCCAMSLNLESTNVGEDGECLRSSQSGNTPCPVIGENHRDVKNKSSSEKPTEPEWPAILTAGHWEGVSKELQSQDPPNKSKTDGAVTTDRPALAEEFRSLMRLTPSSVVIVFAGYHHQDESDKEVFGMLVASFAPVSLDPEPCVSFNIKRPSRTYNQMLQTATFTILAPKNAMLAAAFARPGNKNSILRQALRKKSGVPKQNSGVLWWAQCELLAEKSVDVGDHTIVVGRVVKVGTTGSPGRGHVIIYSDGQYRQLGPCVPPHDHASYVLGKMPRQGVPHEEGEAHMQPARKATEELAIRELQLSEHEVEQAQSKSKADQCRGPFELEASTTPQQGSSQEVAESVVLQEGTGKAQQQSPAAELKYYRRYLEYLNIQIHNLEVGNITATGGIPSVQQDINARMKKHEREGRFNEWLIEKLCTQKGVVNRRIFSIRFPKLSLVHRVGLMPPSGDSDKQNEAFENKNRPPGSELPRKLKRSQLWKQKENNQQPLSQEPVSNYKISCFPEYEDIKEVSSESRKIDKRQHGSKPDGLITYHLHKKHPQLESFPSGEQEQAANLAMDTVHTDQANHQVAIEQNNHSSAPDGLVTFHPRNQYRQRESFPSLEQEQAADVVMDTIHRDQANDQVAVEQDNHTSAPKVEESGIQRRPAKLSEGMQGLYDSFSGWMQDSKKVVEESIDGEAIENKAQSATGTELRTSPSDREGEEAQSQNDDQIATGTDVERSPSGRDDVLQAEHTGVGTNTTSANPAQRAGTPAAEYLRRSAPF